MEAAFFHERAANGSELCRMHAVNNTIGEAAYEPETWMHTLEVLGRRHGSGDAWVESDMLVDDGTLPMGIAIELRRPWWITIAVSPELLCELGGGRAGAAEAMDMELGRCILYGLTHAWAVRAGTSEGRRGWWSLDSSLRSPRFVAAAAEGGQADHSLGDHPLGRHIASTGARGVLLVASLRHARNVWVPRLTEIARGDSTHAEHAVSILRRIARLAGSSAPTPVGSGGRGPAGKGDPQAKELTSPVPPLRPSPRIFLPTVRADSSWEPASPAAHEPGETRGPVTEQRTEGKPRLARPMYTPRPPASRTVPAAQSLYTPRPPASRTLSAAQSFSAAQSLYTPRPPAAQSLSIARPFAVVRPPSTDCPEEGNEQGYEGEDGTSGYEQGYEGEDGTSGYEQGYEGEHGTSGYEEGANGDEGVRGHAPLRPARMIAPRRQTLFGITHVSNGPVKVTPRFSIPRGMPGTGGSSPFRVTLQASSDADIAHQLRLVQELQASQRRPDTCGSLGRITAQMPENLVRQVTAHMSSGTAGAALGPHLGAARWHRRGRWPR
jgi:hypothetical protein